MKEKRSESSVWETIARHHELVATDEGRQRTLQDEHRREDLDEDKTEQDIIDINCVSKADWVKRVDQQ